MVNGTALPTVSLRYNRLCKWKYRFKMECFSGIAMLLIFVGEPRFSPITCTILYNMTITSVTVTLWILLSIPLSQLISFPCLYYVIDQLAFLISMNVPVSAMDMKFYIMHWTKYLLQSHIYYWLAYYSLFIVVVRWWWSYLQ